MNREGIKSKLKGMKIREVRKLAVKLILEQQRNTQEKQIKRLTNKQILKRDYNQCVFCGDKEDLQIHHFKPKHLRDNNRDGLRITLCKYCHWYLHHNPKSDLNHSLLIKDSMINIDGKMFSYNGNRWGKKELKLDKKINTLYNKGKTMREITKEVFYLDKDNKKKYVSVGYVHKVISKNKV